MDKADIDKAVNEATNLIMDLRLTEPDKNMDKLGYFMRDANNRRDGIAIYNVAKTLYKYLDNIAKSSVHLHYYAQDKEVVILQDMRVGKVVSIREHEVH